MTRALLIQLPIPQLRLGLKTANIPLAAAGRLAHPYQLLVGPGVADGTYLPRVLSIVTAANVHTPLEVVFFDPPVLPDADALLEAVRLNRPHFLDIDLRFQFPEPGNRAAWLTVVSAYGRPLFQGPARRHVFWWKETTPPDRKPLTNLLAWDGVLVDGFPSASSVRRFQDRMAPRADELPTLAFADLSHQIRWLGLISAEDYWLELFR